MFGLVVAVLILLVVLPAQLRPRPILVRQLLLLPIVALSVGGVVLTWEQPPLTQYQVLYFSLQVLLAVVTGVARGSLIEVTERRQFAVRRGGWLLVAAWGVTIAARLGMDAWVATLTSGTAMVATFPLFLGITLSVQNAVLAWRVKHKGLRFIPRDLMQRWRNQRRRSAQQAGVQRPRVGGSG